jgi:diguanylate cyclase (GGDEF)-like protein
MMFDLDHFKRVNDEYGHLTGDQVLRTIGEMLKDRDIFRQEDFAGRFGGEEFIVILSNTNAKNAVIPAQRFSQRLKAHTFQTADGASFKVTISIGLADYDENDRSEEAVIQRADQALYEAKSSGRDRLVVYDKMKP